MHALTLSAATGKQAERERLVAEAEAELGLATDHPEDEEILSCRWAHGRAR